VVTGEGELFSQFDSAHHTTFDNTSPGPITRPKKPMSFGEGWGGELKPA
jgi:hypothetical protein